ncbi:hypothetical protein DFH07DRAFT_909130 [Mycena maculata]|uniref:Elongator complex protein 6 n=1 Tax=Mycena maculata TaxID=230809 RepID=A0AAD7P070_9AGAR|nr:hypothetical protein DFH07DRAFT_909130 [Mycena maculata]
MFSPFDLPPGILLLVTDQLSSPADFVLHHSLIDHLKGTRSSAKSTSITANPKKPKVIVLAVSEDLARWKSIASKSNVHLDQQGSAFVFVNVLQRVPPPNNVSPTEPVLRPILDTVVSALGADEEMDTLVIVDDLAVLEWLGFSVPDIIRFVRALYAACRKAGATLLIRQHVLTPPSTDPLVDDLFRHLRQICTYHVEVLPLASGRSGAVSGQVALHTGPGVPRGGVKLLSRTAALQYKLTDGGAVFFERGTGAGVL